MPDEWLRNALLTLPDVGIALTTRAGRLMRVNDTLCLMLGYEAPALLGSVLRQFTVPTERGSGKRSRSPPMQGTWPRRCYRRADGSTLWVDQVVTPLRRSDGRVQLHLYVMHDASALEHAQTELVAQDVSRRRAAERAVLDSKERLATVTDNIPALIAYVDEDLHYEFTNRAYRDWFGRSPESLLGTRLTDFLAAHSSKQAMPYIERALAGQRVTFENVLNALSGEIYVQTTFVPDIVAGDKVKGFYILSLDITERKALERKLVHEATHDALTGLPNRRAFKPSIIAAARRAKRNGQGMALLFLDLDGFKQLNDIHGHEFGDRVLQHFATALTSTVRETDTVCRLAGDEFTIVLETLRDPEAGSIRVAEKILERLQQISIIDGVGVQLSSSIGIATVQAGESVVPDLLIARADAAMYSAKAAGKARYATN